MTTDVKTGHCQGIQRPRLTLSQVLEAMSYPSISETCLECLMEISETETKTCSQCRRSSHLQCIILQGERNTEVRKQLPLQDFICRSCQHPNKCLQCRNELGDFDTNIHSCSICLKLVHHRCHYVPSHIATLPHFYSRQIICQYCLHHFGVREVIDRRKTEDGEFVLVVSNHLSPVRATWIPTGSLVDSFRERLEERLLLSSTYEVEIVLSMHVPTLYRGLTLQECQEMITRQEFYQVGRMSQTFKFLTKWRHSYNSFVWEQASNFTHCRHHISKFLHQVRMNSIAFSNVPKFITVCSLQSCIDRYRVKHRLKVKNTQMSDKQNLGIVCQVRDEENGQKIDLKNVYNLYQKQRKQYINIKSLSLKAEALLDLISNVYFIDKNPSPVAIFTDQSRSSWWITNILQKTPHLSAISLQGPLTHIERLIQRFIVKQNGKEIILKFNILLVSYQCLKMVSTVLNLPQILDNLSILVMDQKMTALARYYYSRVKIARIKFHKEIKQEKPTFLNARCQLPDEGSSSQKKSSLTLSTSHNKQITQNHENRVHAKSSIQSSCQFFYENFFRKGEINEQLMSEDQRLIVLRFILLFGLNSTDRNEICLRIIKFEPTVFPSNSQTIRKIEEYLSYFLAHLFTLSSNKVFNQAQDEIKRYFFFRMHPKCLLKLIARLARVKAFCQLYQKNFLQLQSLIPSGMMGRTLGISKSWKSRYDYIICSKVVAYGYGKWELLCRRAQQWKQEHLFTTFPEVLGQVMQREVDLRGCYEFLQVRLEEIAEYMEKMVI